MAKISILGSGSWGTSVAVMLAENHHDVVLWSYKAEQRNELEKFRENKKYLPGVTIPQNVYLTSSMEDCTASDVTVIAVPSHGVRNTAKGYAKFAKKDDIILNISKGIEEDSLKTLSQVITDEIPECNIAVMSGPSHAEEVSRKIATTNVVACEKIHIAEYIQDIFMNPYFRIYTNNDVLGVELGGSLKNIYALCCGILEGMGMGDNTKAALMTRGLAEMTRLGIRLGAEKETFSGLSGMGDLIVTCTSVHSRNKRAGILIGKGMTASEAQNEVQMVVEGVRTCKAAKRLSEKLGVEMPIINEAYNVLFNNEDLSSVIPKLMGRTKKNETEKDFLNA